LTKVFNNILIPQVQELPGAKKTDVSNRLKSSQPSDFDQLLKGLDQNERKMELSTHAQNRIDERNINFDSSEFLKLKEGMEKARNKGGKDSLIVTDRAAYIVDVKAGKVVTAVDKESLSENIFTKIDSTVFMN
jgi:flagellar operon protein